MRALRRNLLAEDLRAAAQRLSEIDESDLDRGEKQQLQLLRAEYLALRGEYADAETALRPAKTSLPASSLHRSRAHLRIAQGRGLEAMGMLEQMTDAERDQDWHDLYWKALLATPAPEDKRAQLMARISAADTFAAQQRILRDALTDPQALAEEETLPRSLRALLAMPGAAIRIGLVLPLDGPLEAFGSAFLEGFVTAWFASSEDTGVRFTLYDASELNADADYSRLATELIRDRIELVIGPVSRSRLLSMQRILPREVGWIALNLLENPDALREGQFMFELSTEGEVEALARRIRAGHWPRVLTYHSRSGWSQRAADALQAVLDEQGLIGSVELGDAAAVTEEVGLSLLIDGSQARIRNVSRLLQGAVDTETRRRQDLDAIVMLVDGNLASAVAPALRFHDAGDVQRFATSRMIREMPASEYGVLEGTAFFDLPWNLSESDLKRQLHTHFGEVTPVIETFRAIGVDCFRLADRFNFLRLVQQENLLDVLAGASGTLRTSGTHIKRQLVWSQVRSGAIEAVDGRE